MHGITFRKRECFAHKAPKALANRVVKPLDMRGFASFFAHRFMLLVRNNGLIGVLKVTIAHALLVHGRNALPEPLAGCFTPITNRVCDDLACFSTECEPYPAFLGFRPHK